MKDGLDYSQDLDYQKSVTYVSAIWHPVEDPESGISYLSWCVGRRKNACDLKSPENINIQATKMSTDLKESMNLGTTYFIILNATNGAGLVSLMSSNGVVVDYTPPILGVVIDCNDNHVDDVDFVTDETICASWSNFEDKESPINFYEFALCESQNITNCPYLFSNVKMDTNISVTG